MNQIKKAASWTLFGIGHVTSLCITNYDNRFNDGLAYMYQWCMLTSVKLQDESQGKGPWENK